MTCLNFSCIRRTIGKAAAFLCIAGTTAVAQTPKVVLISLDGANVDLVERYLKDGVLDKNVGLGDATVNYDTLAFFDMVAGIRPGPFSLPSTGPAYAKLGGPSAPFFFESSGYKAGAAYYVSLMAPSLSTVRFARYSANFIPRNAPVLAAVDDVNTHVGFWSPQADFRVPERLSPGFSPFPDQELEAMYRDQVATFVDYQTRLALRAISQNRSADLVMIYIEQPDGSGHQFMLTDPRQPTDPANNASIAIRAPGATGQDAAKVSRYERYLQFAYQTANTAVQRVLDSVGVDKQGEPLSDVFVVSDHGMAPFRTAVRLDTLLSKAGIDLSQIGIRTTGPAAQIYVNLAGREPGGTVPASGYQALLDKVAATLRTAADPNIYYNGAGARLFTDIVTRPSACGKPGFCTGDGIGQDSGDVMALMDVGYNFDGTQAPAVTRLGDGPTVSDVYSVPNFYGAHGHNSELPSMSAILYAAGPSLKQGQSLKTVHNIDIAPTILDILGVPPSPTVDGRVIPKILKKDKD